MGKSGRKVKGIRFFPEEIEEIENYEKKNKHLDFSQKVRLLIKKGLITEAEIVEILKKKDEENSLLKEENGRKEKTIELLREGILEDMHKISEKPCFFMVHVDDLKVCGDEDAPIPNYLKRNLTAQICAICRKKKALLEKKQKVTTKSKRSISKIDKKKANKIYCFGLYKHITLDFLNHHRAMCQNCQLRSPKKWMECMETRELNRHFSV